MKYSIIIPTHSRQALLSGTIDSLLENTKDFELIVVDNASTDRTPAYLASLFHQFPGIVVITNEENESFARACNKGLAIAKGDYLILLNNDVVVTPNWAEQLVESIPLAEDEWDARPIGMVGPVSNNAGGNQGISADPYDPSQLPEAARQHHQHFKGQTRIAGFLSGMCLLITRPCFESVGYLDEKFQIGGVEDTEYCTRAQILGWKLAIDQSTFIHHYGQQTLNDLGSDYIPVHHANQLLFMEKYFHEEPHKLVATFRVRNQPDFLRKSLKRAAEFADDIIVVCDRCDVETLAVAHAGKKVSEVIEVHEGWDLYRDRAIMMKAAKDHGADWVIALDADEILEESFTYNVAHGLMNPLNPTTLAYSFPFCTFFLGDTHYRADGIFGRMRGIRMYRNLPNQNPRMVRHSHRKCLHCPTFAPFNVVNTRYRVKHYGYMSQEICDEKYRFYTKLDPDPDREYIGPEGYRHLIHHAFTLTKWVEKNDVTLCMVVKNEELNLFAFLYQYAKFFDDIVIVDTGSHDRTRKIASLFGARVFKFHWGGSFAEARNYAKEQCVTSWLFTPDPDEQFDLPEISVLWKMMESDVHAYLFQIVNLQPDGAAFYSDNVRLLRNIPQIYWTHNVHENITEAVKKNGLVVVPAPFKIKHFGYLKEKEVQSRKAKQYVRALKRELRSNPGEALCHFHLAFSDFEKGKEAKGIKRIEYALKLQPDLFIASKELGLRNIQKALGHIETLASTIPENHYSYSWAQNVLSMLRRVLEVPAD